MNAEVSQMRCVDRTLVVVAKIEGWVDKVDILEILAHLTHNSLGSSALREVSLSRDEVEQSTCTHYRLQKDERSILVLGTNLLHKVVESLADNLGRRVREGIEDIGIGLGIANDIDEVLL